jgi:HSP20 family protein
MLIAIEPLGQVDRSTQRMPSTGGKRTMPMDAYRDGEQLIMKFDLPGIEPDSMELNVENNVLTIKAHRPRQQIEDSQWVVSERLHGTFSAQLHLSNQLDLDNIRANYDQGVLTISVPVAKDTQARRIEISGSQATGIQSVES